MNTMIEQMLKAYEPKTVYDQKNAMKEVMQEIVLCGLSRAGFFRQAAFYGGTAVNLKHLKERLIQSGHVDAKDVLTLDDMKQMLCERFDSIDYEQAKEDVEPFIRDSETLSLWSADFFKQITMGLQG